MALAPKIDADGEGREEEKRRLKDQRAATHLVWIGCDPAGGPRPRDRKGLFDGKDRSCTELHPLGLVDGVLVEALQNGLVANEQPTTAIGVDVVGERTLLAPRSANNSSSAAVFFLVRFPVSVYVVT